MQLKSLTIGVKGHFQNDSQKTNILNKKYLILSVKKKPVKSLFNAVKDGYKFCLWFFLVFDIFHVQIMLRWLLVCFMQFSFMSFSYCNSAELAIF